MTIEIWVNIGLGNGLLPDGTSISIWLTATKVGYQHAIFPWQVYTQNYQNNWISKRTVKQGWGYWKLKQFPPFCYFINFPALSKHCLSIKYHVHIWQVLMQISCSDTWQIWLWFTGSKFYFSKIQIFHKGEINKPDPRPTASSLSLLCKQ